MAENEIIIPTDLSQLAVVHYPDPRLRQPSQPLQRVDDSIRALAMRMFELMFQDRGVGLAAPQVGLSIRLFVASPAFDPAQTFVVINPRLISAEGSAEAEEGCLSLPGISCNIKRYERIVVEALDLNGQPVTHTLAEYPARVFQHEMDHLDGRMLIDRMSTIAKLANRRVLKELEAGYAEAA